MTRNSSSAALAKSGINVISIQAPVMQMEDHRNYDQILSLGLEEVMVMIPALSEHHPGPQPDRS